MKHSDLLKLPRRTEARDYTCNRIAIVPTRRKHEGGYAMQAVIAMDGRNNPIRILGFYDIIWWHGDCSKMRTHTHPKNSLMTFWGDDITFTIGGSLISDCDITVTKEQSNDR